MPSLSRVFLYFLFAVLLSSALGGVVQTQFNLANLQALGAPMTLSVRLHTTALDLLGFSPLFAVLVLLRPCFGANLARRALVGLCLGRCRRCMGGDELGQ
ncbi:hypothetical protein [Pseudomonas sp. Ga0074129]|uniref:hypothetical protein n=1 Tax=Pseudomonas sp. Ga0074129 TaxID=1752219 RepID=UPI000A9C1DFF|nr:hypothetical protein [Pseudomonas sp. Ga0074129]